jgi:hypothetical protein
MTQEELDQLMPPLGERYLYMKGVEGNAFYIWVSNGELHIRNIGLVNEQLNASTNTFSASCTESIRQLLNEAKDETKKSKK